LQAGAALETQAKADLALLCQQIVGAIAHGCEDVSVTALAACIWICTDDGRFKEVARFYLPYDRPELGVHWHRGKGVAGWAWSLGKDLFADLRPLIAKLDRNRAAAFDMLPENERWGLGAAELDRTRRYTGVAAIQLFATDGSARLLGMLILDYDGDLGFDCIAAQAQRWPVTSYIGGAAKILTATAAKL
jgi:hypothetical protein